MTPPVRFEHTLTNLRHTIGTKGCRAQVSGVLEREIWRLIEQHRGEAAHLLSELLRHGNEDTDGIALLFSLHCLIQSMQEEGPASFCEANDACARLVAHLAAYARQLTGVQALPGLNRLRR